MSESTPVALVAFDNNGGRGVRFAVGVASAAALIPQGTFGPHVCITNPNTFSVFYFLGQAGVVATLNCQELLPGTQTVWAVPYGPDNQSPLWIAAITESGTGNISVTRGRGT